jgi:hypothetical protein
MNSATPAGAGIADPSAWIAAHGAMAEALARFQSAQPSARSSHIDDVVDAMAPAFELGFAHSRKVTTDGLEVVLHHRSGWDTSTITPDADAHAYGFALAGLLGIRIGGVQAAEDEASAQLDQLIEQADALQQEPACPIPTPAAPVAVEPEPEPIDLMGPGSPDNEVLPENLAALSDSDKATAIGMLKSLAPDARKRFTVEFRDHFNVPRESKTITPHVTQRQHLHFIQTFMDEIELSGVAA